MGDNLTDVNDYVSNLLQNRGLRKKAFRDFSENNYSVDNLCGVLTAERLHALLLEARHSRILKMLLTDLLYYVDSESMTDENFSLLLKFRTKYRTTYLSCLGHAELSFYQMQVLNRYPLAYEAFSWLFDKICNYEAFTDGDMLHLLQQNPDIKAVAVQSCIDSALVKYGDSSKIETARKWLDNKGR